MDKSSREHQKNLFRRDHVRRKIAEPGVWPAPGERKQRIWNSTPLSHSKPRASIVVTGALPKGKTPGQHSTRSHSSEGTPQIQALK